MKGGVVIIGSLLWQDGSTHEPWKPVRKEWRDNYLKPKENYIPIKFPIRYGRYSENNEFPVQINNATHSGYEIKTNIQHRKNDGSYYLNTNNKAIFPLYTMVLSLGNKDLKNYGTAFLCPFKTEVNTIEDIKECVKQLSIAEGIFLNENTFFRKKWGGVSIYVSPKFIRDNKPFSDEIFNLWKEKLGSKKWLSQFDGFEDDNACILHLEGNKIGTINLDTIIAQDSKLQSEVHSFDFLLVAVTVPKYENDQIKRYPSSKEIGQFVQSDLRRYFQNNYKNGITTFQDVDILKHFN